jgi:hypothetical protein
MVTGRHDGPAKWRASLLGCALALIGSAAAPDAACAQGLFDFLFGPPQNEAAPPPSPLPHLPPPAERPGRIVPSPLGQENVNEGGGSTGHGVAFCVRLCDGQHFPLEQMVKGTAAETCRASCPYSKTKVFFGAEIGGAVSEDGQHYANLDTAFLYRKQLVASCTCNGRNALGLAPYDLKNDPTLHTGDLISTTDGLMAYSGPSAHGAILTPVNPATLPPDIGAAR